MAKKMATLTSRAWNLLRLALFSSHKGGIFRRRFMINSLSNYFKRIPTATHDSIRNGHREFSFDETPAFRFKFHKPASIRFHYLPCINPSVDFDDLDDDSGFHNGNSERHCVGCDVGEDCESGECGIDGLEGEIGGDEGIDSKAEEFIAGFYEQMKLQRQLSYLQYNEMLNRGTS